MPTVSASLGMCVQACAGVRKQLHVPEQEAPGAEFMLVPQPARGSPALVRLCWKKGPLRGQ